MQCREPVECAFRCSPPGIIVSGPRVREKLRETYLLLGILYAGSAAAVVWTLARMMTCELGWWLTWLAFAR
jgi:hypothetical protein